MDVLAGKAKFGHRLNDYIGAARGGVANNHSRSQQGEINELPSIDRQVLYLLLANDRIGRGARRLDQRNFRSHGHLLCNLCGGKREIQVSSLANAELESVGLQLKGSG